MKDLLELYVELKLLFNIRIFCFKCVHISRVS